MQLRLMLLVGLTTVLAVIAVSALLAPVPRTGDGDEATSGSTPDRAIPDRPVETNLRPAPGQPFVLSAEGTGQVVKLPREKEGRIEVHATREPVSVQLGDDGPVELAEPGTPAEFPVFGDATAEGPIQVLESEREIGRVELAG